MSRASDAGAIRLAGESLLERIGNTPLLPLCMLTCDLPAVQLFGKAEWYNPGGSEKHPDRYFYADQYSNDANWRAHYNTTANEIWHQTEGRITHFVAMMGTTGTFVGTTRRLKELNPHVRCISLQPDSPFHGIEGT